MKQPQTWDLLEEALSNIEYKRDEHPSRRRFKLVRMDDWNYAVLNIYTYNRNTYRPDEMRFTEHEFVVPVATYNIDAWTRWVFDRIVSIEVHETAENFFVVDHDACVHCGEHDDVDGDHSCPCPSNDGSCGHTATWRKRIYAPHHGNGEDPYMLWYDGHPDKQAKAPGQP